MPPSTIAGLGPIDVAPVANRDFDPTSVALSPHEYFVLTRCDGKTSCRMILQMTGFPEPQTIAILQRLREEGAILLPGEPPPPPKLRVAPPTEKPTAPTTPPRGTKPPPTLDPTVLAEANDLTTDQKQLILAKHVSLQGATLFEVLDCGPDADKRTLKRAYFKISKDFHPDRFYGKQLGTYQARLAEIFKAATDAWEVLEDDARRAAYLERLAGSRPTGKSQSQAEHAASLFDQACQHEVTGQLELSLKEFAAVVRLDPQTRYLKRAALAALKAQELRSAEEYATKAAELDPRDASVHRTLAKVFRGLSRIQDAVKELELATQLDPQNPHMASELEDLRQELHKS